jgi:hypothetical protein
VQARIAAGPRGREALPTRTLAIVRTRRDDTERGAAADRPRWTPTRGDAVRVLDVDAMTQRGRLTSESAMVLAGSTALAFVAIVEAPSAPGEATLAIGEALVPVLVVPRSATGGVSIDDPRGPALERPVDAHTPAQGDALMDRLQPLLDDPLRWWRVDLLATHRPELLEGRAIRALDAARDAASPEARLLGDAVTQQWRVGLRLLADAEASVASRVLSRLIAVAEADTGELLPAWPIDRDADFDLLRVLTLTSASPIRRRERAETWLRVLPPVALRVIDDAGETYRAGRPRNEVGPVEPGFDPSESEFSLVRPAPSRVVRGMTVGVTELSGRPMWSTLTSPGLSGSRGVPLRPLSSKRSSMDAASLAEARNAFVEASVGRGTVQRATPARPLAAVRPALKLGPLAEELVMATWLTDRQQLPPRAWWTAAELSRRAEDGRWSLYIEAKRPPRFAGSPEAGRWASDAVELWFGGYGGAGGPAVVIDPPAVNTADTASLDNGFDLTRSAEPGVWRATVVLPSSLTAGGELLLGVVRRDPRGAATAWPRPLLPGQIEPGRRRIDLTGWLTLEEELQSTGEVMPNETFSVSGADASADEP